jgi:putative endonuclease
VLATAYYVYLLASKKHGTLYLGVTNDIVPRGYEHLTKAVQGFTKRYSVDRARAKRRVPE